MPSYSKKLHTPGGIRGAEIFIPLLIFHHKKQIISISCRSHKPIKTTAPKKFPNGITTLLRWRGRSHFCPCRYLDISTFQIQDPNYSDNYRYSEQSGKSCRLWRRPTSPRSKYKIFSFRSILCGKFETLFFSNAQFLTSSKPTSIDFLCWKWKWCIFMG